MSYTLERINLEPGSLTNELLETFGNRVAALRTGQIPRLPPEPPWYQQMPWPDWLVGPDPRHDFPYRINRTIALKACARGLVMGTVSAIISHHSDLSVGSGIHHSHHSPTPGDNASITGDPTVVTNPTTPSSPAHHHDRIVSSQVPSPISNPSQSSHEPASPAVGEGDPTPIYDRIYLTTFWVARIAIGVIVRGCSYYSSDNIFYILFL